ncbi:hypothetical protein I302_101614 [Kwoniella bestiolae CBS 10118]|uniref:Uncharacterized protein n=1 Tax=Kwoniella bestiolae CBS 10118 TaxID=1296100 RepID=A0A1B9GCR6_9TREE|nr:hypothetical protein I302_00295 [Kwoniella bestiolae CBS 10118]OCF28806.1 hypothetical protein I302_00295 [Kwoniella bestiolae CBS 10118]
MSNEPSSSPSPDPFTGYHYGLPSRPRLLARSDPSEWSPPRFKLDANFPASKSIRPVDPSHPICGIWGSQLGKDFLGIIDRYTDGMSVSVDVVCIPYSEGEEGSSDEPILWIGVPPDTMSVEQAQNLVRECTGLLKSHEMTDVQVEVKESEGIQLGLGVTNEEDGRSTGR